MSKFLMLKTHFHSGMSTFVDIVYTLNDGLRPGQCHVRPTYKVSMTNGYFTTGRLRRLGVSLVFTTKIRSQTIFSLGREVNSGLGVSKSEPQRKVPTQYFRLREGPEVPTSSSTTVEL